MNTNKFPFKVLATVTLSGLLLTACDDTRVRVSADSGHRATGHHHSGYLTHTPHRHRVSYNSALGLYVVLGLVNTYYHDGHYYRYYNSGWQRSRDYRGWSVLKTQRVPKRLYARHYTKPVKKIRQDRYDRRGRGSRTSRDHSKGQRYWIY